MQGKHWLMILVIFIVGYFVGVSFPATGTQLLSKVSG